MSAELEDIHEECGIFGVWGHSDAARLTYFGLHALQHRGQEGAGIVSNDNGHLIGHRGTGLLTQVFSDEREIERLKGDKAIGHVRYATAGSGGTDSLEYARYFPSAEAAEEYVHKYLGFAGMTCYICHVNWTLASCGSENMEDNEENLLEENGKILSFANYADVKQYQKQRGMEHSTMAITYASRKKKIILAA